MNGQDADELRDGQEPQHLPLRGSQQEITPGVPCMLARQSQCCQAAGVDEIQASQVDDDHGLTCRNG
jgi:hypothetical protein